jgi:hypothetical protein
MGLYASVPIYIHQRTDTTKPKAKNNPVRLLAMAPDGRSNLLLWQELYKLAMVERDDAKLPQRIALAQEAVLDRIAATLTKPSDPEHQELYDALHGLRTLRQQIRARQNKPDRDSEGMRKTG